MHRPLRTALTVLLWGAHLYSISLIGIRAVRNYSNMLNIAKGDRIKIRNYKFRIAVRFKLL